MVDLGFDDDCALLAIHAALDGGHNVHLQLPLLTGTENRNTEELG